MNKKLLSGISIFLGFLLLFSSYRYATTPAEMLPHFMPGFAEGVTKIHYKHAIGAFLLGLALFAYAWFQTGPKQSSAQN
jgi:hypothetical protein